MLREADQRVEKAAGDIRHETVGDRRDHAKDTQSRQFSPERLKMPSNSRHSLARVRVLFPVVFIAVDCTAYSGVLHIKNAYLGLIPIA